LLQSERYFMPTRGQTTGRDRYGETITTTALCLALARQW